MKIGNALVSTASLDFTAKVDALKALGLVEATHVDYGLTGTHHAWHRRENLWVAWSTIDLAAGRAGAQ